MPLLPITKRNYIFDALENRARLGISLRNTHKSLQIMTVLQLRQAKMKIENPFYYANVLDDRKI